MFKHTGEARTLQHNLRIASLLSFVAGAVNVAGFLAIHRLTTHVTGHFAFLIENVIELKFAEGFVFLFYILCFLMGAFVSSFLVEFAHSQKRHNIYVLPVLLESLLLCSVPLLWHTLQHYPDVVAFVLLFSMGLQNSLVTTISNAVVRTTHLTGLFTDLGIELSQLFFYKEPQQRSKLFASIRLRLTIICFFFIGGIVAGLLYSSFEVHVLILAAAVLVLGLVIDYAQRDNPKGV